MFLVYISVVPHGMLEAFDGAEKLPAPPESKVIKKRAPRKQNTTTRDMNDCHGEAEQAVDDPDLDYEPKTKQKLTTQGTFTLSMSLTFL